MPRVSVLSREESVRFPEPGKAEAVVSVSYSTPLFPPRIVQLPAAAYRRATTAELAADPRSRFLPANPQAEEAERRAIRDDLAPFVVGPLPDLEFA